MPWGEKFELMRTDSGGVPLEESPNSRDGGGVEAVFGLVDREAWVVTAAAGKRRGGLLATWVMQASLDPSEPVVVVGVAPNHHTATLIDQSQCFAAHLLRESESALALNFAIGSGRDRDKLADLEWSSGSTGSPVLAGCMAWLECRVIARYDVGDRMFYWADVVAGEASAIDRPLRERQILATATDEQRRRLRADLVDDIEQQRSLRRLWRARISGE